MTSSYVDGIHIILVPIKGGCESITPLNLINFLYLGFERGNSHYQRLWTHLENRENMVWGQQIIIVSYFASAVAGIWDHRPRDVFFLKNIS